MKRGQEEEEEEEEEEDVLHTSRMAASHCICLDDPKFVLVPRALVEVEYVEEKETEMRVGYAQYVERTGPDTVHIVWFVERDKDYLPHTRALWESMKQEYPGQRLFLLSDFHDKHVSIQRVRPLECAVGLDASSHVFVLGPKLFRTASYTWN